MSTSQNTWAIVLAAGDGRRLNSLTTNAEGLAVPKQFCSLRGGASLLREALRRATAVAAPERVCTVVAESHRQWWEPALGALAPANIIVQPRNRGTANGILLPLLHIFERDPTARVVLLPSDHHFEEERVLGASLRRAVRHLHGMSRQVLLLGIAPETPDPELGYIVPGDQVNVDVSTVVRFAEKPSIDRARSLIQRGALWNSFIMAARANALLDLFRARIPDIVRQMHPAVQLDRPHPAKPVAAPELYEQLPDIDFSKQVIEGSEMMLRLVAVPRCGWSDLGTPNRLAETLRRLPRQAESHAEHSNPSAEPLNLSVQHARLLASAESS